MYFQFTTRRSAVCRNLHACQLSLQRRQYVFVLAISHFLPFQGSDRTGYIAFLCSAVTDNHHLIQCQVCHFQLHIIHTFSSVQHQLGRFISNVWNLQLSGIFGYGKPELSIQSGDRHAICSFHYHSSANSWLARLIQYRSADFPVLCRCRNAT